MPEERDYSEHELVNLLKSGNESAFHYLYDRYSGTLFRVILYIIPDRVMAQDILQEVFLNIWSKINTYNSAKGRLFTWMFNIARNQSRDMLRSKAHQNRKKNHEIAESEHLTNRILLAHLNIDGIGIDKFVGKLKPDYQILINMYYFEGYTVKQITEIKKLPMGTVKTRIRLALCQLRIYVR